MSAVGKLLPSADAQILRSAPVSELHAQYNISIGYLRAFITLLVVAHHAALAYHPFAPPVPTSLVSRPRWWMAFPVTDNARWSGFGLLVGFNDVFFMSLMFFLSGLFVWKSLQRKGTVSFLRDRAIRLGVPFISAVLIAPLAYYPAYLMTASHSGLRDFWHQWLSLRNWPVGPAWFIWLLLSFDCVAAALFLVLPRWGEVLSRMSAGAYGRPALFFGLVVSVSAIAYVPMSLMFTAFHWTSFGPFFFQTSRILHYFVYFMLGIGVGAVALESGLLAQNAKLGRRWVLWTVVALLAFWVYTGFPIGSSTPHTAHMREVLADASFVLSCAASCFAFLALFVRFAKRPISVWNSLTSAAYGIYVVHYGFVIWLQYALLREALPAIAKGSAVLLGAVLLSWGMTAAIRRIPAVARVI